MSKSLFTSKTFWANVLALVVGIIQSQYGFVIPAEVQGAILALINVALRTQTSSGVHVLAAKGSNAVAGKINPGLLLMVLLLAGAFFSVGCVPRTASRAEVATKSLLATQATLVGVAKAANDLCVAGTIDQTTCLRIRNLYGQAKPAYDLAADAIISAIDLNTKEAWSNQELLANRLTAISTDIAKLAYHNN